MFKKTLFAGAVLALTCTQAFAANGPSGEWELESLAGINSATLQQLGRPIKINFSQGRVSGSDGCNYINATYQSKDYHLKIMTHRMASTKMACTGVGNTVSNQYIKTLGSVIGYQQSGQSLNLINNRGQIVASYKAPIAGALMNTNWQLMSYLDARQTARVSSINTEKMTLQFGKDGTLSGNSGCNTYSAPYRVNPKNNRIDLGSIITTQKFCAQPADLMKEEQAFLGDLQQVKSFKRSGKELELFDGKGKRLLDLRQM